MFRIVRQSATRKRIRRPGRAKPVQTNAELSTAVERKIYEHIRTVVESDAMNELKDYLDRGRRFAPLDDATLQDLWVTSFKAVVHDERRGMSDVVDANAELTQRQ